jgi:hypothetical protein
MASFEVHSISVLLLVTAVTCAACNKTNVVSPGNSSALDSGTGPSASDAFAMSDDTGSAVDGSASLPVDQGAGGSDATGHGGTIAESDLGIDASHDLGVPERCDFVTTIGGAGIQGGPNIAYDPAGEIVVAAGWQGTFDLSGSGPVLQSAEALVQDLVVARYDRHGGFTGKYRQLGTTGQQTAYGVAVDSAGAVIVVGQFMGEIAPGVVARGGEGNGQHGNPLNADMPDAFAARFVDSMEIDWIRRYGETSGTNTEYQYLSAVDADARDIYVGGKFSESISLERTGENPPIALTQGDSLIVAQLATDGGAVRARTGGDLTGFYTAVSQILASGEDVFVAGYFSGTIDFGGACAAYTAIAGENTTGERDAFVAKLNRGGDCRWVRVFAGNDNENVTGLAVDGEGGVIVAGRFSDEVRTIPNANGQNPDNGCGILRNGGSSSLLSRLDATGACLWSRHVGSVGQIRLAAQAAGGFVVAGQANTAQDLGCARQELAGIDPDILLASFDSSGACLTATRFAVTGTEELTGLVVPAGSQCAVLAGNFNNELDFGSGEAKHTQDEFDAFLAGVEIPGP